MFGKLADRFLKPFSLDIDIDIDLSGEAERIEYELFHRDSRFEVEQTPIATAKPAVEVAQQQIPEIAREVAATKPQAEVIEFPALHAQVMKVAAA